MVGLPRGERRRLVHPRRVHRPRLCETFPDCVCGQNPSYRKGVDDLAAEHPADRLGDGVPLQGHVGFFVMRLGSVYLRQTGCQINPHGFVAETGCGVQIDQYLPRLRLQAGLLAEFPGGGQMRGFAVDVEQSGGQLP